MEEVAKERLDSRRAQGRGSESPDRRKEVAGESLDSRREPETTILLQTMRDSQKKTKF